MNGIDKIAGKIAEDARQEANSILAEAKAQAAGIAGKYAALAKEESDVILAAGEEQAKEIGRRAASAAEQEAKQQLLATKQKMISRAFDIAMQKLSDLPETEYVDLLARLAAEASSTGGEAVILSSKDLKACGDKVLKSANELLAKAGKKNDLTLSEEAGAFSGGLMLRSGRVETNCTLDAIIRLSKENLAPEVAMALFPVSS
jgi:V/A-type H+-transporting ATPase subunit E